MFKRKALQPFRANAVIWLSCIFIGYLLHDLSSYLGGSASHTTASGGEHANSPSRDVEYSPDLATIESLPVPTNVKSIFYLTEHIESVKGCPTCNKVQEKLIERSVTANVLHSYPGGANMLVFGVGFDSVMWAALNPGRTVFLEDDIEWLKKATEELFPFIEAHVVEYSVRAKDYPGSLDRQKTDPACHANSDDMLCFLRLRLPADLEHVDWDIILVDAPSGGGGDPTQPTRQMAIFTASKLARRKTHGMTHVMVHDVHRPIEDTFSRTYLCYENLLHSLERSGKLFSGSRLALRHYTIPAGFTDDYCHNPVKLD